MNAVNARKMRERVASTQVQYHDTLGLSVLLIVGEAGLDQQLFPDESSWSVAALADFPCRAQILNRRLDRPRVTIDTHLDELFGSVHLGLEIGFCAAAYMALHARDVRMR